MSTESPRPCGIYKNEEDKSLYISSLQAEDRDNTCLQLSINREILSRNRERQKGAAKALARGGGDPRTLRNAAQARSSGPRPGGGTGVHWQDFVLSNRNPGGETGTQRGNEE